jgi:hypothetical protein
MKKKENGRCPEKRLEIPPETILEIVLGSTVCARS